MEADLFEKLPADSLRGRIARQIREAILNGNLREGERLVERKLATALGASLTAVREAMIELEAEGFLTKTPNSATHVTTLSRAQAEKVFAVRRVVEGLAVEEACRVAGPERVAGLERAAREMMEHARTRDSRSFNRADMCFHQALWQAAENEYLEIALKRALMPYFAFGAIRISSQDSADLDRDASLHMAIVEAIRRRDPEAARRAYENAIVEWQAACRADLAQQTRTTASC
jgi:DNA-binding GntR family transcriptional regulator